MYALFILNPTLVSSLTPFLQRDSEKLRAFSIQSDTWQPEVLILFGRGEMKTFYGFQNEVCSVIQNIKAIKNDLQAKESKSFPKCMSYWAVARLDFLTHTQLKVL